MLRVEEPGPARRHGHESPDLPDLPDRSSAREPAGPPAGAKPVPPAGAKPVPPAGAKPAPTTTPAPRSDFPGAPLPAAPPHDMRDHLPGLEPDRRVTDWGRSEFVDGVLERTLWHFLYHYWLRVEVEGIANVPDTGPALLIANRAGALPLDAAMIAAAVRREHARPRPVHFAAQRNLGQTPGLDMLLVKAGVVTAHPANLHRLLFDEGQLVLAFPEGAHAQPLRARYRVREFSRADLLGAALRARAPIVPVAVLGSEEAAPVVGGPPLRGPLRRLASWALARPALSLPVALPAKVRLRFLAPVDPAQWPAAGGEDEAIRGLGDELRALIQDNLFEMVAQRRSVWLG